MSLPSFTAANAPTTSEELHHVYHGHPHLHPKRRETIVHNFANEHYTPTRTVVLAIDNSPASERAFEWAKMNILKSTDLVVLANVRKHVSHLMLNPHSQFMELLNDIESKERSASHELLENYCAKLNTISSKPDEQGVVHPRFTIRAIALRGDPREELLRKVKDLDAKILVCGMDSSKSSGNSVSRWLAKNLDCHTIIVK